MVPILPRGVFQRARRAGRAERAIRRKETIASGFPQRTNSASVRTPTSYMELHGSIWTLTGRILGFLAELLPAIVGVLVARFLGFGFRMDRHSDQKRPPLSR